jgi:hypothetical protein
VAEPQAAAKMQRPKATSTAGITLIIFLLAFQNGSGLAS